MAEQYIFFCCSVGNEALLKEEIKLFFPVFSLSYSRKGFLTFKNKGIAYDQQSVSQLRATFATRAGICLGKATPDQLSHVIEIGCQQYDVDLDKAAIHCFSLGCDLSFDAKQLLKRTINEYSPINKSVIDLIVLAENEIWVGLHKVGKHCTHYPNGLKPIVAPVAAPSRSYIKLAEIIETYHIQFDSSDLWIDFGSAPGGATSYLLQHGCTVWGVDPAKMDPAVLAHPNYTHLARPVQDLSHEQLPDRPITWIHSDININPKQSIKEVLRLAKKYHPSLKGILFTVPVIRLDHIKHIEEFEDMFYEWGFSDIVSCQVPTHKSEYVVIASR